ncbi:MAG: DUF1648 domain-containing protein [Saprospiraceae bacterium]
MSQPIVKVKLESLDYLIEAITFFGVIVLLALPVMHYSELPGSLPRHYDANGVPDAFGGKGIIWTLPIIGVVMYFGLLIINRFPHTFNYPKKVTAENAEQLYKITTRLMRTMNAIIIWAITYITFATIQTALGYQNGLSVFFAPGLVFLVIAASGYFLKRMKKVV